MLTPNALLQTARADLRHRKNPCFLKRHVSKAATEADILRAAVKGYREGQGSMDRRTSALYADLDALKEALRLSLDPPAR